MAMLDLLAAAAWRGKVWTPLAILMEQRASQHLGDMRVDLWSCMVTSHQVFRGRLLRSLCCCKFQDRGCS